MRRRERAPDPQLDLFAPKPEQTPAPAPEKVPVSDRTGGPLNADEARRTLMGKSIGWRGCLHTDGTAICRACFEREPERKWGEGGRVTVYEGGRRAEELRCVGCGAVFSGEHCLQEYPGREW